MVGIETTVRKRPINFQKSLEFFFLMIKYHNFLKTDAKRLEKTFEKLDFDCHTFYGDIPLWQAEREIRELSKCQTGKDMFCLCLLTHGDWTERGQIMLFSDGNFTTLERLTEVFNFFILIEIDLNFNTFSVMS